MGNADSKSLEDYRLQALLEEAAAPVDVSGCTADTATDAQQPGETAAVGSRLKRLLEAGLSSRDIAAVLGTREDIERLVIHRSQALLCLLDQLMALVSATADTASQRPITPAQSSTLLTALRLLTLLLPVLLESRELEQLLFWTPHPRCPRACSGGSSTGSSRRASARNKAAHGGGEEDAEQTQQQRRQLQQQQQQLAGHVSEEGGAQGGSGKGTAEEEGGNKTDAASATGDRETQETATASGGGATGEDGLGDAGKEVGGSAAEVSSTDRDLTDSSRAAGVAAELEGQQRRTNAADASDFSWVSEQRSTAADSQSAAATGTVPPQEGQTVESPPSAPQGEKAASDTASASAPAAIDAPPAPPPPGESGGGPAGAPARGGSGKKEAAGPARGSTTVGQDMLNQLFRMLFLPGFTVLAPGYRLVAAAAARDGEEGGGTPALLGGEELLARLPRHKLDVTLLWRAGIGASETDLPPNFSRVPGWMMSNRVEVIHCLLACFAGPLYETLDEYQLHVPQWVRLATAGNVPYTANLFCSLLSTACGAGAVGSSRMLGLFGSPETQELTTAAVQLLIVLLDFNVSVFVNPDGTPMIDQERKSRGRGGGGTRGQSGPPLRNVFRSMVMGLQREEEFDFIYEGIAKHLEVAAARCCKGGSRAAAAGAGGKPDLFCGQLLILTWHLLTLNGNFLRHICAKKGAHHLLHPLVCLLLDASRYVHRSRRPQQRRVGEESSNNSSKDRAAAGGQGDSGTQARQTDEAACSGEAASGLSMIGLQHVSSFILLVLSSERDFAVRLNEPFTGKKIPPDLPVFNGCYADLLCLAVHRVLIDATGPRGSSESLVDMLLTVLCNVSAYVKSFCLESCMRLMNLMEKLSRRQWLLSAPQHHHDVCFLLDVFNNIIQYQYEGNRQLVYSILRHKQIFLDLQDMTLEGGEGAEASVEWARRDRKGDASSSSSSSGSGGCSRGGNGDATVVNGTVGTQVSSSVEAGDAVEKRRECAADAEEETQGKRGGWNRLAADEDEDEPWAPTEAWFDEWKSRLPLQTILRLIKCLLPQVEAEVARREATDQKDILQFLEKTTMVLKRMWYCSTMDEQGEISSSVLPL